MLWIIFAILLIAWVLGLVGTYQIGAVSYGYCCWPRWSCSSSSSLPAEGQQSRFAFRSSFAS